MGTGVCVCTAIFCHAELVCVHVVTSYTCISYQVQERLCKKEVNKSTLLAVETANVILSLESYCVPDSVS